MALPAQDNFNRAGPPLGANWTGSVGNDLVIASSTYVTAPSSADASMYWSADAPAAAQYCQIKHTAVSQYAGALVRSSATDWVMLDAAKTENKWKIEWYNAGVWTQIGSDYATTPAVNDIGKLTANGSAFEGFVNGTSRISGSNASAPATGYGGLYVYSPSDGLDDFEVGNLDTGETGIRLDSRWLNFWQRGQFWYHFWQDTKVTTGGEITGNLSVTLEGINLSASGNISVNGTLSKNLDGIGISAAGTVSVVGSLTKTLDDISKTITGGVEVKGDLSKTLDGITFEANGTVEAAQITGTLNITLDAIALSASGTVAIAGGLDKILSGIGLSAIGAVSITSVLTKTLDGISLSAAGIVSVSGISNITLDGIGINAAGVVSISGGLTKTLDNISLAGAGVVTVTGTLTKILDAIILSASGIVGGEVEITGTLDVAQDDLSITAMCQVAISGNLNITLDNIILIAVLKRNVIITIREIILWKNLKNIRNNPSSISHMSTPLDRRGR